MDVTWGIVPARRRVDAIISRRGALARRMPSTINGRPSAVDLHRSTPESIR